MGSPVRYLAFHQIEAGRCSLFLFPNNGACYCKGYFKVALKGKSAGGAPEKLQAYEQQVIACRQDPIL